MKKTKILCTIGPSTSNIENLVKLINSGMDAARLNFSHGSHEIHLTTIQNIRKAEEITGKVIGIIQDLQGPKIRTGKIENDGVIINDGNDFIITIDNIEIGNSNIVSTNYKNLISEVKSGNTILIDDGYIILNVIKTDKKNIYTKVQKGGLLKNNKGIITPGVSSSAPSLSEKDIEDLKFGLNNDIDAVALSFVRSERDIIELKTAMKLFGKIVPIISKIERYEGYEDIIDIINESDGIMVARGDLGLEMPAEQVPVLQKDIINQCNYYGKPVIIATQMLESMIENPRPTRAEASDVANAVLDGADCVMLSGETSVGKYPFEAVQYMKKIIETIETKYPNLSNKTKEKSKYKSDSIAKAACVLAESINAKAIVALTQSGYSAINLSKYRPSQQIYALHYDKINKYLSIVWGIENFHLKSKIDLSNFDNFSDLIKKRINLNNDDSFVFINGASPLEEIPEYFIKLL